MFEQIKNNVFTIHGVITSLIHIFLIVGGVTSWILFQTQVMGFDPSKPPAAQTEKGKGK